MWKLIKTEKLTDERFLNYYKVTYLNPEGKEVSWCFASRNSPDKLVCNTGKVESNCVCIIPRTTVDGEPAIIITREYRLPIGGYVYGFPAGIIDEGEDPISSAVRELHEEIGATKVDNVTILTGPCLNSEGLTDESTITIQADIIELGNQELQDHEDIQYEIVKLSDLNEYMKGKVFSVRAGMYIPMVLKQYEMEKEKTALEEENQRLREELKQAKYAKRTK